MAKIEQIKIEREKRIARIIGVITTTSLIPIFLILWYILLWGTTALIQNYHDPDRYITANVVGDYDDPDKYTVEAPMSADKGFFYKIFIDNSGDFFIFYWFLHWVFIGVSLLGLAIWPIILIVWGSVARNIFFLLHKKWKWPTAQAVFVWSVLLFALYYYFYYYFPTKDHFYPPIMAAVMLYFKGLAGIVRYLCTTLYHDCGSEDPDLIIVLLINALGVLLGWRLVKKWLMRVAGWFGRLFFPSRWKKP